MNVYLLFFLKEFGKGFLLGILLRTMISIMLKKTMTPKGFFMSGIVAGLVYAIITFVLVVNAY